MSDNVTAWTCNCLRPQQKHEGSLFNIVIAIESQPRSKVAVVRDCTYNAAKDEFTQIDDKSTFERKDIIEWQRQHQSTNYGNYGSDV